MAAGDTWRDTGAPMVGRIGGIRIQGRTLARASPSLDIDAPRPLLLGNDLVSPVVILLRTRCLLRSLFGNTVYLIPCCFIQDGLVFALYHFEIVNLFRHGCLSFQHHELCLQQVLVRIAPLRLLRVILCLCLVK